MTEGNFAVRAEAKAGFGTLSQVMAELDIGACDVFLVGDGSGVGRNTPNGWACGLINLLTGARHAFYGGLSHGSVNMAEMLPYIQALTWFHELGGGKALRQSRGVVRCSILTDSAYTVVCGQKAVDVNQPLPDAHSALWASARQLCRDGYLLSFYHRERSTTALNQWADLVSSCCRKAVVKAIKDNLTEVDTDIVSRIPLEGINP